MAHIDDYLRAQVTPQLSAGEQILGFGVVRRPYKFNPIGVPTHYEEWLATSTNLRLILFRTKGEGLFNVLTVRPQALNLETRIWWYEDLREVTQGNVTGIGAGIIMGLCPHKPLGPYEGEGRRYDIFPAAEGLDAHATFYAQFRPWIMQQVASGAFPMDAERRAKVEAMLERERAEAERKRQLAEERKRKVLAAWASLKPILVRHLGPALLLLVGLGAAITGGFFFVDAIDRTLQDSASVDRAKAELQLREADLVWRKAGGDPPADCPEKTIHPTYSPEACHYCTIQKSQSTVPSEFKLVSRGSERWLCPSVANYEDLAVRARKQLKDAENASSDVPEMIGGGVGLLFGLLALLGSGAWFFIARRKRRLAAT
jgi:hypothetical protein